MNDRLDTIDRRTKILEFLIQNKKTTMEELSKKFNVCVNTIVNDLYSIGRIAPIYTKQGKGGGIYIMPEYQSNKNYLTDIEESILYGLMQGVDKEEKRILCGIIIKFTKDPFRKNKQISYIEENVK